MNENRTRGKFRTQIVVALAVTLTLVSSCGILAEWFPMKSYAAGGNAQVSSAALPLPSSLLSRTASGLAEYRVSGSNSDFHLQPQHAQNGNEVMDFRPAADPGPAGLAYALYRLNSTAYDGHLSLRLGWTIPPVSGTAWVALADIAADRWVWHSLPADNRIALPEGVGPHSSPAGDLLALVAVTGGGSDCELLYVRLGNEPPLPSLLPSPQKGPLPLDVNFDAGLSRDPDGSIVRYDFDYGDGAGLVEEPGPVGHHQYTAAGVYSITVFITDDEGGWAQDLVQISAGTVANHAPVAQDQFQSAILLTSISFSLMANDQDPGDQLTYAIVSPPQHGNLDSSNLPNVHYLPGAVGQDSFTFRAFDGTAYSNTATVTIMTSPGDGS